MPIQHAIWTVGDNSVALSPGRLPSEQKLEEMILRDPSILSSEWMLIGRQEVTSHGGRIDLLAIAPDGSLVREPWNGEYYVSFGDPSSRSWEGFISAGGGSWYSQTLKLLSPGDRVWVKVPKTGYVGVGLVTESVLPAKEFHLKTPEGERPAVEVLKHGDRYRQFADDPEKSEYFVRVAWLDTVPESRAVDEVGLFGNQNTVCQPVTPKWRHTVERLKSFFPRWNEPVGLILADRESVDGEPQSLKQ